MVWVLSQDEHRMEFIPAALRRDVLHLVLEAPRSIPNKKIFHLKMHLSNKCFGTSLLSIILLLMSNFRGERKQNCCGQLCRVGCNLMKMHGVNSQMTFQSHLVENLSTSAVGF